jgi:Mce-associated membrane protein
MTGRRMAWWSVVVMLVVGTVAALAVGIWQGQSKKPAVMVIDGPDQRAAVQQVASADVKRIFTFTPENIDANNAAALELMTENFGREFKQKAPDATTVEGATSQVNVAGTAVIALTEAKASVLVFMNRTATRPGQEPIYDGSRLRLELERIADRWLIDDVKPV